MSQTLRQRRALSQHGVTGGIGDLRHAARESDAESMRAMSMLAGAIFTIVFVLLCAVVGTSAADWWAGGTAFVASVPAGAECTR